MRGIIAISVIIFLLFSVYMAYSYGLSAYDLNEDHTEIVPLQEIENVTLEWSIPYGTTYDDSGYKIVVNESKPSSRIFVAGEIVNFYKKFVVLAINSSGYEEWNTTLQVTGSIKIFDIVMGQDGFIYLAGTVKQERFIILKLASNGTVWTVFNSTLSYKNTPISLSGRGGFAMSGDSFYVACKTNNLINSSSLSDVYIARIGFNGSLVWTAAWGGNNSEEVTSLDLGPNGYVYVVGYSKSFSSSYDIFLLSYHPNGTLISNVTWDSNNDDIAYDMYVDQYGYVYITGQTGDDVLLLKAYHDDFLFYQSWDYNGTEAGYGIHVVGAHIYITGYTYGNDTLKEDIILLRYDLSGNLLSSQIWAGDGTDIGYGIYATEDDEIYICGATTSFSAGDKDIILLKYSIPTFFGTLTTVDPNTYLAGISILVLLFAVIPLVIIVIIKVKSMQ